MERALHSKPQIRVTVTLVVAGLVTFLAAFNSDLFNVRIFLLAMLGVVAGGLVSLPYRWAIVLLFAYLGIEGMAKLLTNYNPVVHVGADLLVIALTARWFLAYLLRRQDIPEQKPPLIPLFALHLIWFFIQFMNPYSIGLIPSLAGAKVYLTMPLLYAFGFYLAREPKHVRWFMAVWVFTLVVQLITGFYQFWIGPQSVTGLSASYASAWAKFGSSFAFRPFGTTSLPGAPSVFVYLGFPFALYFIFTARSWSIRAFLIALLPAAVMMILICQVRAQLLKTIIGTAAFLLLVLGRASGQTRRKVLIAVPVVVVLLLYALPHMAENWVEDKRGIDRSLTLFDAQKATSARAGAAGRIIQFAQMVPLGAGLSRTGAAAGKFADEVASDPYFPHGFFSDNFWAATIAEIGIPGSAIITAILVSILFMGLRGVLRTPDPDLRTLQAALLCPLAMIFLGLWGAEGLLYNPEAAFFWFFSGCLMQLARRYAVIKT